MQAGNYLVFVGGGQPARRQESKANSRSQTKEAGFPHEGRVPHISLVFREMWNTTALSL